MTLVLVWSVDVNATDLKPSRSPYKVSLLTVSRNKNATCIRHLSLLRTFWRFVSNFRQGTGKIKPPETDSDWHSFFGRSPVYRKRCVKNFSFLKLVLEQGM
jgi:hypothetical protein